MQKCPSSHFKRLLICYRKFMEISRNTLVISRNSENSWRYPEILWSSLAIVSSSHETASEGSETSGGHTFDHITPIPNCIMINAYFVLGKNNPFDLELCWVNFGEIISIIGIEWSYLICISLTISPRKNVEPTEPSHITHCRRNGWFRHYQIVTFWYWAYLPFHSWSLNWMISRNAGKWGHAIAWPSIESISCGTLWCHQTWRAGKSTISFIDLG